MAKKRSYRTLDDVSEEYYCNHPDEIDGYLATTTFEEYVKDACILALLAQLRMIVRIKGVSVLVQKTGITRNGIQKALSEQGNPKFESINSNYECYGLSFDT